MSIMKKFIYMIMCMSFIMSLSSCDKKDDIQKDIDSLNAKLDEMEKKFSQLNENINTYYNLVDGKVMITGCETDEYGNYILSLSNNTTWKVYCGMPESDIPVVGINDLGEWVYIYDGQTFELGVSSLPTDGNNGVTPTMVIGEDGKWYYRLGDGEPILVDGPYNVAKVENIQPSIFEEVKLSDSGNIMQFKPYGASGYTNIPFLGGLDLVFKVSETETKSVDIVIGETKEIDFEATNVSEVIICPTELSVNLDGANGKVEIKAPAELPDGNYIVDFEIYSPEGYRLIKTLEVIVTDGSTTETDEI